MPAKSSACLLITSLGLFLAFFFPTPSQSAEKIYIDIGSPGIHRFPIALPSPRPSPGTPPEIGPKVYKILKFDLELSGLFRILDPESYLEPEVPSAGENFPSWVTIGAEGLVRTEYSIEATKLSLTAKIYDPIRGRLLGGKIFTGSRDQYSLLVHQSD